MKILIIISLLCITMIGHCETIQGNFPIEFGVYVSEDTDFVTIKKPLWLDVETQKISKSEYISVLHREIQNKNTKIMELQLKQSRANWLHSSIAYGTLAIGCFIPQYNIVTFCAGMYFTIKTLQCLNNSGDITLEK